MFAQTSKFGSTTSIINNFVVCWRRCANACGMVFFILLLLLIYVEWVRGGVGCVEGRLESRKEGRFIEFEQEEVV